MNHHLLKDVERYRQLGAGHTVGCKRREQIVMTVRVVLLPINAQTQLWPAPGVEHVVPPDVVRDDRQQLFAVPGVETMTGRDVERSRNIPRLIGRKPQRPILIRERHEVRGLLPLDIDHPNQFAGAHRERAPRLFRNSDFRMRIA